jgi:DNA-binding MarR family transcriptional regulator
VGENGIKQEVRTFLADHIDSVLELELLLLLRAHAQPSWTGAELAGELKIDRSWAAEQLAKFATRGILSRSDDADPRYRYAPATPALDAIVAAVADAYASHRVTMIGLIFSKPTSTLKSFADAFRIRKDKSDA